jgi:threonine aldolase
VAVEQTSNRGGGSVWPLDVLAGLVAEARQHDLRLHMDGARLMNAVVASGVSAKSYAAPFDSVWLDLSKGLGCPVGGVLAGSAAFIEDANVWKHRFGGAMRQAGILAAAGLYALDHNVERLAEDHSNARAFATRVAGLPGVTIVNSQVETNLVFVDVARTQLTAKEISDRLLARGIRIGVESASVMRAVFHLDVDAAQGKEAADAFAAALDGAGRG